MEKNNTGKGALSPNAKKFAKNIQNTITQNPQYNDDIFRMPSVDFSFIQDSSDDEMQERLPTPSKGAARLWKRFALIAAGILVFFAAVLATAVYINSEPAVATKFKLEKKLHEITSGLLLTDENAGQNTPDDNSVLYHIKSMRTDDMVYAHKIMPRLCTPEYVPEGYTLDSLNITKYIDGAYIAVYDFTNKSDTFSISIQQQNQEMYEQGTTSINVEGEMLEMGDRTLYIWGDDIEETYGVIVIKDVFIINITGTLSQSEMVLVAENLRW